MYNITTMHDKQFNCMRYLIPMVNEGNCNLFKAQSNSATWVYYLDGEGHNRVPPIVLPDLVDIFGGEELIRRLGYRKHWSVFKDLDTNICYYSAFSKSPLEDDRRQAESMMRVDLDALLTL